MAHSENILQVSDFIDALIKEYKELFTIYISKRDNHNYDPELVFDYYGNVQQRDRFSTEEELMNRYGYLKIWNYLNSNLINDVIFRNDEVFTDDEVFTNDEVFRNDEVFTDDEKLTNCKEIFIQTEYMDVSSGVLSIWSIKKKRSILSIDL